MTEDKFPPGYIPDKPMYIPDKKLEHSPPNPYGSRISHGKIVYRKGTRYEWEHWEEHNKHRDISRVLWHPDQHYSVYTVDGQFLYSESAVPTEEKMNKGFALIEFIEETEHIGERKKTKKEVSEKANLTREKILLGEYDL